MKREITRASFHAATGQPANYGPCKIAQVERAYRSIGLLPNDSDLSNAILEFRRFEQLTIYNATNGGVMLSPSLGCSAHQIESAGPASARATPFVFGIVTTLLEQRFHWQEKLDSIFLDDQRLAHRALAAEFPSARAAAIATPWRGDQHFALVENDSLTTARFSAWTGESLESGNPRDLAECGSQTDSTSFRFDLGIRRNDKLERQLSPNSR